MNTPIDVLTRLQPRDVIAIVTLTFCFTLLAMGKDGVVAAITTAVVGYYFSKRVYEETNKPSKKR